MISKEVAYKIFSSLSFFKEFNFEFIRLNGGNFTNYLFNQNTAGWISGAFEWSQSRSSLSWSDINQDWAHFIRFNNVKYIEKYQTNTKPITSIF